MSPPCETPVPEPSDVTLALDADITNGSGPCTQIDDVASMAVGDTRQVGVCLLNPSGTEPIAAFQYRVRYDDRIVVVPNVANVGTALDDNPDANAGTTTFTSSTYPAQLGGGWDCSGGVGAYPDGDILQVSVPGVPGDGIGTAYSGGCGSAPGPNTLVAGPLGVITFNAVAGGRAFLNLFEVSVTNDSLSELGSCDPNFDVPMLCLGATLVVEGEPPPTATITPIPTATSTPSPPPLVLPTRIANSNLRRIRGLVD
jgi:hypothetical protein